MASVDVSDCVNGKALDCPEDNSINGATSSSVNQEETESEYLERKKTEIEDVIAGLCLGAPSDPIKFCLRHYKFGNDLKTIEKDLNKEMRSTLIDTADYLLIRFDDKTSTKKSLAADIIDKIQNLMPDTCSLCDQRYRVGLNEKPLLECLVCHQAVHAPCWRTLIQLRNDAVDVSELNSESMKNFINPLGLPGVHYICPSCLPNKPSTTTKSKAKPNKVKSNKEVKPAAKKKSSEATSSPLVPIMEAVEISQVPSDSNQDLPHPSPSEQPEVTTALNCNSTSTQTSATSTATIEEQQNTGGENHQPVDSSRYPIICRYFKKGSCKHGVKGQGCKFQHPKVCARFMQHGTRRPRGCSLGRKCKEFHPQVCINSLRTGECFDSNCRFNHISGTKRERPQRERPQTPFFNRGDHTDQGPENRSNQHPRTPHQSAAQNQPTAFTNQTSHSQQQSDNHFLGLIRLTKAEIMESINTKMDTKFAAMFTEVKSLISSIFPKQFHQQQPPISNVLPQIPIQPMMQPHPFPLPPMSQRSQTVPSHNLVNTTANKPPMLNQAPYPPSLMNVQLPILPKQQHGQTSNAQL